MRVIKTISAFREARNALGDLAFIPTMGALHEGHLSLVRHGISQMPHTAVSIFVNPTQFGPNEDFDQYPRTIEADLSALEEMGVDLVFLPEVEEIYPPDAIEMDLDIPALTGGLEGDGRPGHFQGVMRVCLKLFNIVQPNIACFGRKDFQQWRLIEAMTRNACLPMQVHGCPIVRDDDGLALSSRNRMLSPEARRRALTLHQALFEAADKLRHTPSDQKQIESEMAARIEKNSDDLAYAVIRNDLTLKEMSDEEIVQEKGGRVLVVAGKFGGVRLLDNVWIEQIERS